MVRDNEGLPNNLSPLELMVMAWSDEAGIHLAYFNARIYDKLAAGENVLDHLDEADYIVSLNPLNALRMAENILHKGMEFQRAGKPMVFDVGAPAPFPPDSRHRIFARERGAPLPEHGGVYDRINGVAMPMHQTPVDRDSPIWKAVDEILGNEYGSSDSGGSDDANG